VQTGAERNWIPGPSRGLRSVVMDKREYFDLSPKVGESIAVFPGDTPYRRRLLLDFEKGHSLVLSGIETTLHLGAHADAPSHYHPQGAAIDERDLNLYFGPAQVVDVSGLPRGERVGLSHWGKRTVQAPRILFSTGSFPDPNLWNGDFNSLSPELLRFLAAQGVRLVGIDTPSVDPAESKALEAHQALYAGDFAVLEGLVLEGVPEGVYELTALPLRLSGADASPVRAVLWKK